MIDQDVGKDATAEYEKALHSEIANKMLPQYRIGKLKEAKPIVESQTKYDDNGKNSKTCVIS